MVFFIVGLLVRIFFGNAVLSLANSVNTPWGIITSNFVFDGFQNMEAMLLFLVFLYLTSVSFKIKLRNGRYIATLVSMFAGGIIANFLWFYEMFRSGSTVTSAGQSGVVYAFWGACFSLFLFDTIIIIIGKGAKLIRRNSSQIGALKSSSKRLRWIGGACSVVFSIIVLADLYDGQRAFFSELPHINYFVHIAAFFSGVLICAFIYLPILIRNILKVKPITTVQL
ncbi:MAG: hypothetical protein RE469_04280 [Cuniculiplasma divulgatum]|nr:MAG: hypothetical protein RE469_04280 [Cuniculiplasma divulgatum]